MSKGRPAGALYASFDHRSGAYAGGSAVGIVDDGAPRLAALHANAGYARRLGPTLSLDAGVSHARYFFGFGSDRDYRNTEAYVGLAVRDVSARLSYSPDYYQSGSAGLYAEVQAAVEPAPDWLLSGHAAALTYLDSLPYGLPRRRYDWRIGISRQAGRYGFHLDLSGRLQDRPRYSRPRHARRPAANESALVATVTRAF